jgi:AraC-like DNA-binding protein
MQGASMALQLMDTFTTFVDSLAESLDDHDASGEDLAARAYLSRFHFDRVVSAVSGETPVRLRRRILLERAAFRLVTTRATVLEVALEAGYSSNEAFTRAFRRAYGAAPASWRAAPARIQLDTPNGVHFHPPGGLRLPARDEVSSMDLMRKMVEHHVWLVGEIVDRAGADRRAARRADRALRRGRRRRPDVAVAPVAARRTDGHVERRDGQPGLRLRGRAGREHRVDSGAPPRRGTGVPRPGA